MSDAAQQVEEFVAAWPEDSQPCLQIFLELKDYLEKLSNTSLTFHARPGITYSLRGVHDKQKSRPLFALVDIIDDSPRWLSVCFYGELVADPQQHGNIVPGGLLGEDGLCFDMEEPSGELMGYVKERMVEAHSKAHI